MNVYFILNSHLFFRKEFLFSNILVNMIFECSYLFLGCETGHPLSTYATAGMEVGSSKMCVGEYREGWLKNWS